MKVWTSAPANAFGPGYELAGKYYKGQQISALSTRKYIVLNDGTKIHRKGARIDFKVAENKYDYRKITKLTS